MLGVVLEWEWLYHIDFEMIITADIKWDACILILKWQFSEYSFFIDWQLELLATIEQLVNIYSGSSQNTTGSGHDILVYRQSAPVPFWLFFVPAKSPNRDLLHPLIAEVLCRVLGLISDGSSVVCMGVPGHVGWQVTRRRIALLKLHYSCQCLAWLSLTRITNHSYVFRH